MSAPTDIAPRASYPAQLLAVSGRALAQLVRTPSHSRRAEAARKLARHSLWLSAAGAALVIVLMVALLEMSGTPALRVHLLMGTLLLARLLHPLGMYVGPRTLQFQICRVGGISLTLLVLVAAAITMLSRFWP